jgi:hypothetical protein
MPTYTGRACGNNKKKVHTCARKENVKKKYRSYLNTENMPVELDGGVEINDNTHYKKRLLTWSRLEIRMQDDVTVSRLIMISLKLWKSSNTWEQL